MDLDWEYKQAGEYETYWFREGYRYRVEKDDSQSNCWRAYYKWDKWTPKSIWHGKWRPLPGYPLKTKKDAQRECANHNKKPREKWTFDGRVTPKDVREDSPYYFENKLKRLGYWRYKRAWSSSPRYLNPAQVGGDDPDENNEKLRLAFVELRGDNRFSRDPKLVKLVKEFDGTIPMRDEGQPEENLDRLPVQSASN